MNHQALSLLQHRTEADDIAGVAELLDRHRDEVRAALSNDSEAPRHVLCALRSAGMADLFLQHGLTVEKISEAWAPGIGLNEFSPAVAEHLLARGATASPHALAALGLVDRLRESLDREPSLVQAKGGDGCRPLHFSRNVETAQLLVERGAELDARDDDHDSTPAQWRIGDAPDVTRFLLQRGAQADIFMAAGLGDLALARQIVRDDPACATDRIGHNSGPFPGIGARGGGGTIYQWTLSFNQSPHEIGLKRGHRELFEFLWSHTPARHQLLVACTLADRERALAVLARSPGIMAELDDEDRSLLAKFCWETNLNLAAVRLMLDVGFPIDAPEFNHGFQALHNAAWCGDGDLVELLLQRGHPVGTRDPRYQSTALGFAIHSCVEAKRHPKGDFPRVVRLLLEAGMPIDEHQYPSRDSGIDAVIESYR